MTGQDACVPPNPAAWPGISPRAAPQVRTVICHYHIFKNSGTSFDAILRHSFGDRHLSFDGPFPFFTIDQEQLDRIITRKTGAVAFSSHQILLPAPVSPAYRVLSVVFLRDPVLRAASIWRFKRQSADGTRTGDLAARLCFADWIAASLDDPSEVVHVSNGQTRALAAPFRSRAVGHRTPDGMDYDLPLATANLRGATHIGRTEHFAADILCIADGLSAEGLSLRLPPDLHLNATERDAGTPADRVARVLGSLPPPLADRLIAANRQDSALTALADRLACTERAAA
jgi:hypothetical protein